MKEEPPVIYAGECQKGHKLTKGYRKNHRLEKVDVGFVLYRLDKAPGRFFDNQRNVREIACQGIAALLFERSVGLYFFSCSNSNEE